MFKTRKDFYSSARDKHGYLTRDSEFQNMAVDECFNSFAERVESYKKYRYNYEGFREDYPKVGIDKKVISHYINYDFLLHWDEWLFDYCFGDIIND